MLARLILVVLLALGAMPSMAVAAMPMPAECHGAMAARPVSLAPAAPGRDHPAAADHRCAGCAALADWLAQPIAVRLPAPASLPTPRPVRLALRGQGPPTLRPPRIG